MITLLKPLGQWRNDLLWRLFGLVLIQLVILQAQHYSLKIVIGLPPGLQLMFVSGFLLISLGPRLITLILTVASMLIYCVPIFKHIVELQVSEEYIILLILPIMSLLLTLVSANQDHETEESLNRRIDIANVLLFRITIVVVMSFAAFHKVNQDFLNPQTSCAVHLLKNFEYWWSIPMPRWFINMPPIMGVISEALIPILLFVCAPAGIIYTVLTMGFIGSVGATAFTMIIMVMSFSFLCNKDIAKIKDGIERYGWGLVISTVVLTLISYKFYIGSKLWYEFYIFHATVIALLFCSLCLFINGLPKFRLPSLFPADKRLKKFLIIYMVIIILNGFMPYLGGKFRLSFAMLSNLRVDSVRWNHLFMPRVSPKKKDHFIHLTKVQMDHNSYQILNNLGVKYSKQGLYPGLFSPMSFKHRLDVFNKTGATLSLWFTYKEKEHIVHNVFQDAQFRSWLKSTPDSKMYQEWLIIEGPQPCFH